MKNKFPTVLFAVQLILLTDIGTAALLMKRYPAASYILLAAAMALIFASAVHLILSTKNSMRRISEMNDHLETSAGEYMSSLPAPVAVTPKTSPTVFPLMTALN